MRAVRGANRGAALDHAVLLDTLSGRQPQGQIMSKPPATTEAI